MTHVATIPVGIHATAPKPGDAVLGRAEALIGGRHGEVRLTTRGLYLLSGDQGWGIDLNALARAMADAVAPPSDGGRNG